MVRQIRRFKVLLEKKFFLSARFFSIFKVIFNFLCYITFESKLYYFDINFDKNYKLIKLINNQAIIILHRKKTSNTLYDYRIFKKISITDYRYQFHFAEKIKIVSSHPLPKSKTELSILVIINLNFPSPYKLLHILPHRSLEKTHNLK